MSGTRKQPVQSHRLPTTLQGPSSLQRCVDRSELGVEFRAHSVHGGDDRQRNARGDQAVLDGGGAALVLQKSMYELHD